MVNNTKQTILNKLKSQDDWISGEEISRKLGISRVAVWKQIKTLADQGYPVLSGPKGYLLEKEGDTLSNLEFSDDEGILFYEELTSTMDEAVRQIGSSRGKEGNFLVLADHQSGGIGREEKEWDSPSGGIYLTFVVNGNYPLDEADILKKRGILAALKTLKGYGIENAGYGETGDILITEKKIGGILEEYQVRGDRILWFALGLGLHLNDTPAGNLDSVNSLTGLHPRRSETVRRLKSHWDELLPLPPDEIKKQLSFFRKI